MSTKTLDINQLEEGFHELQAHSDNQFSELMSLKETIVRLETENKSLKLMIDKNLPDLSLGITGIGISNEQLICEVQLTMLKDLAVIRELTTEEARKFQIFTDVLAKVKAGKKPGDDFGIARMTDEELIKAAAINVSN